MTRPTLRPFQVEANEKVAAACRAGARVVVLQSPTGSGKTVMGCDLIGRAHAKGSRVLHVTHLRKLVDQFSGKLTDFDIPHGVVMRGHRLESSAPVQVSSRDTLLSMAGNGIRPPPADLVIVDEGRHAAAPKFRELLAPYEAAGARIILLDATPVMPDGTGLGGWAKAMVCAAKVTDLVRDNYLVPVRCFAPDRKHYQGKVRRRGISGDLVESWKRFAEDMPTVLFTSRVQHSHDAVRAFCEAGIPAAHVDADTHDDDRDRIFAGLDTVDVRVVSNVGIIREGVDIPRLGCVQFYMNVSGRVAFLQGCGRMMRPYAGKDHGVLIDHSGAVFRHGFPDENTEWVLNGNVDEEYRKKHDDGDTPEPRYCKHCELLYHGQLECPQCGRAPAKPPRSVFAPPPLEAENEVLTEAERGGALAAYSREEKVQHWLCCIGVALKQDRTMGAAAQTYKRKYREFPADDFPAMPQRYQWKKKVSEVFPDFGKKRANA